MTRTSESTELRRCIGSKTFAIEAHEAPVDDFPIQASQRDGLGRMCRSHWTAYTNALRKAAAARKATAIAEDEPVPMAPAHEHTLAASLVGDGEPIESATPRRGRRAKAAPERDVVAG